MTVTTDNMTLNDCVENWCRKEVCFSSVDIPDNWDNLELWSETVQGVTLSWLDKIAALFNFAEAMP